MDTVNITPTPEACHQIARLFRALKADAEALATRAEHALDALDATDDDILALWGRALLRGAARRRRARASGTWTTTPRARVRHMDDGLEALGPYADATDGEGSDDAT